MTVISGLYCVTEAVSIVADGYTTSGLTTFKTYKLWWATNVLFFIPGALYMFTRISLPASPIAISLGYIVESKLT